MVIGRQTLMDYKAAIKFDDKTVEVDTRTRYKLSFSKPLRIGQWVQETIVSSYSITHFAGCGVVDFEYDGTEYRINMSLLDMITVLKPT
jgi:hypothetical protein